MTTATKRVLPADVYDALELSALVYDGIGAGRFAANRGRNASEYPIDARGIPFCAIGHAIAADPTAEGYCMMREALSHAGIDTLTNDIAVSEINKRHSRRSPNARVSFAEWCAELGVERGS